MWIHLIAKQLLCVRLVIIIIILAILTSRVLRDGNILAIHVERVKPCMINPHCACTRVLR